MRSRSSSRANSMTNLPLAPVKRSPADHTRLGGSGPGFDDVGSKVSHTGSVVCFQRPGRGAVAASIAVLSLSRIYYSLPIGNYEERAARTAMFDGLGKMIMTLVTQREGLLFLTFFW